MWKTITPRNRAKTWINCIADAGSANDDGSKSPFFSAPGEG